MNELVMVVLRFLAGYTVTHYALSTIWANRTGVIITAAVLGVLAVLFWPL